MQLAPLTAQLRHRGVDTAVEMRRGGRTCTRHEVGVCWEVVHVQCDPCHRHARHEGAAQAVRQTGPRPSHSGRRGTPHTQRGQCWVRGPPPVRADGGALTHGELRSQRAPATMPRTRSQRLRETMEEDGWAGMPEELFEKVLEALQPDGPSKPQDGGLGFSQALAAVRLVCAGWKAVHDAMVSRLVLSPTRLWACWCGGSRRRPA